VEYYTAVLEFLTEHKDVLGSVAAVVAIFIFVWAVITRPFRKEKKLDLTDDTIEKIAPRRPEQGPQLTVADFIRVRREMKADLEADLATAHADEKALLSARIGELEKQLADPDAALAEAQERIAKLEALLERSGNNIGGDRIAEARDALERGDYSIADDLFAEIEAHRELEVQEAARAAFGRGEIAEAEVRWGDAADHYARAARLDPGYHTLIKAGDLLWRAGRHSDAIQHNEQLVDIAKLEFGEEHERTATALNNLAGSYRANGRYDEAEPLYRQSLEIVRQALGEAHPNYAIHLNNLAGLLKATGRYDEAEPLYRQALEIDCKELGEAHPNYASDLNNLAELLRVTGRYGEADPLYRQSLEITRKTLGEAHPTYASGQNNLAGLLQATGRYDEAEPLYRQALEIDRKVLGEAHPDYAIDLNNLAGLLQMTGRIDEAEPLYRQALEVVEAALGADHPDTQTARGNLEAFLAGRDE